MTCYPTSISSSQSWIRFHNNNIAVDDGTTSSILLNASNSKVRDKDRGLAAVRGLAFAGSNIKSKLLRCSDARINIYDPHSVQYSVQYSLQSFRSETDLVLSISLIHKTSLYF